MHRRQGLPTSPHAPAVPTTQSVNPNVKLVASSTILLAKGAPTPLAGLAASEADSASFMFDFVVWAILPRETPVPIPNTVVKPFSSDDTEGAAPWESKRCHSIRL